MNFSYIDHMQLRRCKQCGPIPEENFYHTEKRGYYGSKCKQCTIMQVKDRYRCRQKTDPIGLWAESTFTRKTIQFKQGVSSREFMLTRSDLVTMFEHQKGLCGYCGDILLLHTGAGLVDSSPCVDRIDNDGGYVLDNVIICCFACNSIKGEFTTDELERRSSAIVKRLRVV